MTTELAKIDVELKRALPDEFVPLIPYIREWVINGKTLVKLVLYFAHPNPLNLDLKKIHARFDVATEDYHWMDDPSDPKPPWEPERRKIMIGTTLTLTKNI